MPFRKETRSGSLHGFLFPRNRTRLTNHIEKVVKVVNRTRIETSLLLHYTLNLTFDRARVREVFGDDGLPRSRPAGPEERRAVAAGLISSRKSNDFARYCRLALNGTLGRSEAVDEAVRQFEQVRAEVGAGRLGALGQYWPVSLSSN